MSTRLTDAERQAPRQADRQRAPEAIEALTTSEGWQAWLELRRHFRRYSAKNKFLIALQCEDATWSTVAREPSPRDGYDWRATKRREDLKQMGTRRTPNNNLHRETVQQLIRQFAATYAREMDSVADELGLTRTQAVLLGTATEPGSIRELAERIGCDPSNLTGPVQRLHDRDLIVIEPDPTDRRVKRVALSEAGVKTVHRLNDGGTDLFTAINAASKQELAVLRELLDRVLTE